MYHTQHKERASEQERQTEAAKKEEERAEEGWGQGGQQRHEC